jgi:hypothetical protein
VVASAEARRGVERTLNNTTDLNALPQIRSSRQMESVTHMREYLNF